ncbi:flagellar biosynthesis protein FlhA [Burkholderia stagnalis]|uniref:flagellar biosynthesis protein FlhA n=1 Tax=Burkholderia stagnalis TaxID=1503054 RepID=UPI000756A850|nr:flagellar biosynthesis protein FlhA [Burkholderia stagnalis]KVC64661.1 flagellar biosynthesis protein FlhA [Burkholderia stagnalis]KVN14654.1 flagellar biosynthesis protein FlhA [Burkholderia stagnalis]KWI66612.1 flagellar biosynthesis protein FlhA [Burkholderia stagnalis]KWK73727.1 flagellar biosynthesis protein FlhA [Burkholderia stagnalis]KWN13275.1 flagellar biosynthesis protein FlhA [Burkholderia stagnalis]
MNWLGHRLRGHSDLALVFAASAILLILFAPIPAAVLDLLIIVNFAFAFTILLLTFYVTRPVEFSTFPSLLLIATLFRLSLNVAATRLILSGADAGQVIGAIGEFAVQGNYVIGLIVFFILVVVQYVVVTNGAQRVSEVAARFVLDAMPGQQMSIDADLNMGLIDQDEAKRRRKTLEREAGFYGSMDGASKFVKGDAIAGIIILLIDILGGWAVGVAQMGMPFTDAVRTFTLLTIGDGIVTQVPALIISVATGIIVTRSSADSALSSEALRQLARFPKIQLLVAAALTGLVALPGMPKWPAALLALAALGVWVGTRERRAAVGDDDAHPEPPPRNEAPAALPAVEVVFGAALTAAWQPMQAVFAERIATFREQYADESGFVAPAVVFRDSTQLPPDEYEVRLFGIRFGQAMTYPEHTLAIHPAGATGTLPGTPTREPAFGLPAVWIADDLRDRAKALGHTCVDPVTALMTHVTELIKTHAARLFGRPETTTLLDGVRERQPGLVDEIVPNVLAVGDVQQVLQGLLAEQVPIRDIDLIVQTLADIGRREKDPALLVEAVRQRLGHAICQRALGDRDALAVLTLDPALEAEIARNLAGTDGHGAHVLDPRIAEPFLGRLLAQAESMMRQGHTPTLLCRPDIRRGLKAFSRRVAPRLVVLSVNEVPDTVALRAFATVGIDPPPQPGSLPVSPVPSLAT